MVHSSPGQSGRAGPKGMRAEEPSLPLAGCSTLGERGTLPEQHSRVGSALQTSPITHCNEHLLVKLFGPKDIVTHCVHHSSHKQTFLNLYCYFVFFPGGGCKGGEQIWKGREMSGMGCIM